MTITIDTWKIRIPDDIEIYRAFGDGDPELIAHSHYGNRFRHEADRETQQALIRHAAEH